jgi:hypothetical protein
MTTTCVHVTCREQMRSMMRATLIRRIRSHGVREATSSCRATTTEFPRCLAQQNWKSEFISSLSLRPWQFFPQPISVS